ncbi:hypothetical protein NXX53_26965 [Bacteroides salyersiae]|nr:hypothetical protein [Bacteroides salyersiae]
MLPLQEQSGGISLLQFYKATNAAKIDLAGQIQTKVSQLIEAKVANDDMGQEEAASLSSVVGASKSVISATLGRVVPLVEVYRTLDNKNVEVMVTLGYSMEAANKAAISAVRAELAKKSEDLAKELDKARLLKTNYKIRKLNENNQATGVYNSFFVVDTCRNSLCTEYCKGERCSGTMAG